MINGFFTLLGSNSVVDLPKDLSVLIKDDVLIDPRDGKPMEMDALYLYFDLIALEQVNNVDYSSYKKQLAEALFTPILRYGFYKHMHWTKDEIHLRFTSSALFLICYLKQNSIQINSDLDLESLLLKHISYGEYLDNGYWFFHDSLEKEGASYPDYNRFKNVLWGSSPTNLLILNTHIDTLVLLLYYLKHNTKENNEQIEKIVKLAVNTLNRLLYLKPNLFHKVDSRFRELFFKSMIDNSDTIRYKVLKKYLYTFRFFLKNKYPLFFFPDGYSEREIGLAGEAILYHVVNIWDLCRLQLVVRNYDTNGLDVKVINEKIKLGVDYLDKSRSYSQLIIIQLNNISIKICEILIYVFQQFEFEKKYITMYINYRKRIEKSASICNFDPLFSLALDSFEIGLLKCFIRDGAIDFLKISNNCFLLINYSDSTTVVSMPFDYTVVRNEFMCITRDSEIQMPPNSSVSLNFKK